MTKNQVFFIELDSFSTQISKNNAIQTELTILLYTYHI